MDYGGKVSGSLARAEQSSSCLKSDNPNIAALVCLQPSQYNQGLSSSEKNHFLVKILKLMACINFNLFFSYEISELNPEKVKREVSRLKKIKLERHRNIKFDSEIISRKIVKYSFVIEQFLRKEKI